LRPHAAGVDDRRTAAEQHAPERPHEPAARASLRRGCDRPGQSIEPAIVHGSSYRRHRGRRVTAVHASAQMEKTVSVSPGVGDVTNTDQRSAVVVRRWFLTTTAAVGEESAYPPPTMFFVGQPMSAPTKLTSSMSNVWDTYWNPRRPGGPAAPVGPVAPIAPV